MKIVSVVGARPQFVKLFPISRAIPTGVNHQIVHTGQHYDESMSQIFFDELQIPRPIYNLDVGSGTHAQQTAAMMIGLERSFLETKPDVVLVYGDTNSTIAAALVASKMHIPVAHLEAGLRSFNRFMPEELNRIATDHLSNLLLAPTTTALEQLQREGLGKISHLVGDVMVDALLYSRELLSGLTPISDEFPERFLFCTIHRAENVDEESRIRLIFEKLSKSELPIVLAGHPRLVLRLKQLGIDVDKLGIQLIGSQSYLRTIQLIMSSSGVITDSGGLQKESYFLGKPTLIVRAETEWPEVLEGELSVLDFMLVGINSFHVNQRRAIIDFKTFGNGESSRKTLDLILREFQ
ncbi:MAG: UDP-N-acetylglucosamine 2-epimerase (non-hydrolyzing) [Thermoleophilia bacterium]